MSWYRRTWRGFRGWPRWAQLLTVIVVIGVIAAAAGSGKKNPSATVGGGTSTSGSSQNTSSSQNASSSGGSSHRITKAHFGAAWPLTVSEGTLGCQQPPYPGAVTFTTDNGTVYWINGTAGNIASQKGWRDVKPIWKKVKHPLFAGQRKDIGVLIDAGLKLCGS